MTNKTSSLLFQLPNHCVTHILTTVLLLCSAGVYATAPRINADMFGAEKQAEIVSYELAPMDANIKQTNAMINEIIVEAFKAANLSPTLDTLPSKQLASYAITHHESVGLIGSPSDLTTDAKHKYHHTVLAFRNNQPVALILNNDQRGNELYKAFEQGLQTIIKNGKYNELLEKYLGKDQIPADYLSGVKKLNPGWK